MKFIYTILPHKEAILCKLTGSINYEIFVKALRHAWSHPDYQPEFNTLVDLREASVDLTTAEISSLIEMLVKTKAAPKAKFTLVVDRPFEAALAMIFESKLVKAMNSKNFTDLESAADFISVTPEEVLDMLNHHSEEVSLKEILASK